MHTKHRKAILTILVLLMASMQSWAAKPIVNPSPWSVLSKNEIWSVAWSPSGDYIAFVAADERGGNIGVDGHVVSNASVWLMKSPGTGGKVRLRKLTRRTVKQGIPVGLFWLSKEEIGWAASADYPRGFTLCAARLSNGKVRQIADRRFRLHYVDNAGNEPYDGPRDIYYDRASRSLFFTGNDDKSRSENGPLVSIGRYSLVGNKLDLRKTRLAWWSDISTFTDGGGKTNVYVGGSEGNPDEPKLIREFLWPSVSHMRKVVRGGEFVRVSPDGRTISWLEGGNSLILYDLTEKTRTMVAKWKTSYYWDTRGCPYSWSPTGRAIACSDGKQIRIHNLTSRSGRMMR